MPFKAPALDLSEDELKEYRRKVRNDLSDLQPWAIVYKGETPEQLLTIQSTFFPSAKVIRININQGIDEMDHMNPDGIDEKVDWTAAQLTNMAEALRKQALVKSTEVPELRVRYHHQYAWDMQVDRPGQMMVCWKVTAWGQTVVVNKESYDVVQLEQMDKDFREWLWNNSVRPSMVSLNRH